MTLKLHAAFQTPRAWKLLPLLDPSSLLFPPDSLPEHFLSAIGRSLSFDRLDRLNQDPDLVATEDKWVILETFKPPTLIQKLRSQARLFNENYDPAVSQSLHAILCYQPRTCQLVLAIKGTSVTVRNIRMTVKDLVEDFSGIWLNRQGSSQRVDIQGIVANLKEIWYPSSLRDLQEKTKIEKQFSFTGHSLGGFLSEVGVHHCLSSETDDNAQLPHVSATVFESPGGYDAIMGLQSTIVNEHILIHSYDITSYLARPNRINSIGRKIGSVYQVCAAGTSHKLKDMIEALQLCSGTRVIDGAGLPPEYNGHFVIPLCNVHPPLRKAIKRMIRRRYNLIQIPGIDRFISAENSVLVENNRVLKTRNGYTNLEKFRTELAEFVFENHDMLFGEYGT